MPSETQVKATELTYGIEIECGVSYDADLRVGSYSNGTSQTQLPAHNRAYWKAKTDGSLYFSDRRGVEFVSPVMQGKQGLDDMRAVCAALKANYGARVNQSCGIHLHVGFPTDDMKVLQRLVRLVHRFENALYAVTGTPSRKRNSYCKSIRRCENKFDPVRCSTASSLYGVGSWNDRYQLLNLTNLINGRMPTVEFRVFSGSLNPNKIAAWTRICLALVEMAFDGVEASWDINPKTIAATAGGSGEREVKIMQYYIWKYAYRAGKKYGDLGHDHFTLKNDMKTMIELARKFDQ